MCMGLGFDGVLHSSNSRSTHIRGEIFPLGPEELDVAFPLGRKESSLHDLCIPNVIITFIYLTNEPVELE
jgi:hypothetical protein